MSRPAIIDRARLCGSLDIVLAVDARRWYLLEGVELRDQQVLELLEAPDGVIADVGREEPIALVTFDYEADAIAAFTTRVDAG